MIIMALQLVSESASPAGRRHAGYDIIAAMPDGTTSGSMTNYIVTGVDEYGNYVTWEAAWDVFESRYEFADGKNFYAPDYPSAEFTALANMVARASAHVANRVASLATTGTVI